MKVRVLITVFIACIFYSGLSAQDVKSTYNKALADSLKADEYGMKSYVFVILKTGTNSDTTKANINNAFAGHMKNMERLVAEGKLIVAGPFQKNDKAFRGLFILNAKDINEAKTILETDPAISQKFLEAELYGWYGSAALPLYLKYTDEIQKKSF